MPLGLRPLGSSALGSGPLETAAAPPVSSVGSITATTLSDAIAITGTSVAKEAITVTTLADVIEVTGGAVTSAAITKETSSDLIQIQSDPVSIGSIAAVSRDDTLLITGKSVRRAGFTTTSSSDAIQITGNIVGITQGSVSTLSSSDEIVLLGASIRRSNITITAGQDTVLFTGFSGNTPVLTLTSVDIQAIADAVWASPNKPITPTAIDIAAAVRQALLTELVRIDATISSRLATGQTVTANVVSIKNQQVTGEGTAENPWRPV